MQLVFKVNIFKNVSFIETEEKAVKKVYGINVYPVKEISKVITKDSVIILAGTEQNSFSMAKQLEEIGINFYYTFGSGTREYLTNIEQIKYLYLIQ